MHAESSESLTVRQAADHVGRSPETIRRWVWSGRLRAHKQGNRLVVAKLDLQRVIGGTRPVDLSAWLRAVESSRARKVAGPPRTAADLIVDDRRRRAAGEGRHAAG